MGMLSDENANRPDKSTSSKSSSGSTKSSGSTSNHASEREIDRSTGSRSTTDRSSSASSDRAERSTSSVGSDRREIDRSLSERSTGSDRSTGLNTSGNRATGAGPMSTSNRNTTSVSDRLPGVGPTGFAYDTTPEIMRRNPIAAAGSAVYDYLTGAKRVSHADERGVDRSLGSRTSPSTPTGGLYSSARATEIKSMKDYDVYQRTDLASKNRAAENKSMADLAVEKTLASIRAAEAGTVDPYNRLVGGGPVDYTNLSDMTLRQVFDYQKGMIKAGHASTALGAYQIKNSTLKMVTDALGIGLDQKFTPELQDQLARGLLDNRAGRATVGGNINVDRFANELANEWAAFKGSSGSGKYDGDGKNKGSVSYDQVRDLASGLIDYGIVSGRPTKGGLSTDLPSAVAQLPTARPSVERFAETYLGGSKPNTGGLSPKQVGAYVDAGLNRSYSPLNPVTRVAASSAPPQQAAVRPANRDASGGVTVIGDNKPATQPEQKSGSPIVAGGIDVLLGSIPGVGMGATVLNAGLSLTGNRTIGQRIADDFANGGGKNGSVLMAREGSDRPEKASSGARGKKSADPVVRFEETYLAPSTPFDDGIKRPTPGERWGGIGLG